MVAGDFKESTMGRPGVWELLIIFAVLLLLFGGAKLPQLGSSIGSAIRNFKKGFADESTEGDSKPGEKATGALAESGTIEPKPNEKVGSKQS
jgi:sec-independent protein translocase protein TatA